MRLDIEQLTLLPIFKGIREEDLPAMLTCLGSFQKNIRKMKLFFWKAMKSEMLVLYCLELCTWSRWTPKAIKHFLL